MMANADPVVYTLLNENAAPRLGTSPASLVLEAEKGSDETKIKNVNLLLRMMLSGEPASNVMVQIIRFFAPTKNKQLKRLLLFYYEICEKTTPNGELRQEIVLLCNSLISDLLHHNEYIRGCTLRFLTKIKERELLEPLVPSMLHSLNHPYSYVRRNVIPALHSIYKKYPDLVPNMIDLVYERLVKDTDDLCKRNCVIVLMNSDTGTGLKYLRTISEDLTSFSEPLQLIIVMLIAKLHASGIADSEFLVDCAKYLVLSSYDTVKCEAVDTIMRLDPVSPQIIKTAVSCYIELLERQNSDCAKLEILSKIQDAMKTDPSAVSGSLSGIFNSTANNDLDVCKKVLSIVVASISSSNCQNVVKLLGDELLNASKQREELITYNYLVLKYIIICTEKFPETKKQAALILTRYTLETEFSGSVNAIESLRQILMDCPEASNEVIRIFIDEIKSGKKMMRFLSWSFWLIGECAADSEFIEMSIDVVLEFLKTTKIFDADFYEPDMLAKNPEYKRKIRPETLYSIHTNLSLSSCPLNGNKNLTSHDAGILDCSKWMVMTVIGVSVAKLFAKYTDISQSTSELNILRAKSMLCITLLLKKSAWKPSFLTNEYVYDLLTYILNFLKQKGTKFDIVKRSLIYEFKKFEFDDLDHEDEDPNELEGQHESHLVSDKMSFRLLDQSIRNSADEGDYEKELLGALEADVNYSGQAVKQQNTLALTGFSDPVYVEVTVVVKGQNCLFDVFVFSQTNETLQNISISFTSQNNNIKIDQIPEFSLRPQGFYCLKIPVSMKKINNDLITGSIMYSTSVSTGIHVIQLEKIKINMTDFIYPIKIQFSEFEWKWRNFEWENKVKIETKTTDLLEYLNSFLKATNVACITNISDIPIKSGILSANLHAKTVYGECIIASILAFINESGRIEGNICIRCQKQGVALCFGEITSAHQDDKKINLSSE